MEETVEINFDLKIDATTYLISGTTVCYRRPVEAEHERGQREDLPGAGAGPCPHQPAQGERGGPGRPPVQCGQDSGQDSILNLGVLKTGMLCCGK